MLIETSINVGTQITYYNQKSPESYVFWTLLYTAIILKIENIYHDSQ